VNTLGLWIQEEGKRNCSFLRKREEEEKKG
jgi:hypothetical protein